MYQGKLANGNPRDYRYRADFEGLEGTCLPKNPGDNCVGRNCLALKADTQYWSNSPTLTPGKCPGYLFTRSAQSLGEFVFGKNKRIKLIKHLMQ